MTRYRYPDESTRTILVVGADNAPVLAEIADPVTVYTNAAATALADITDPSGGALVGSVVTTTENSGLPDFLGPDAVEVLYGKVGTSIFRIRADLLEVTTARIAVAIATTPGTPGNPGPQGVPGLGGFIPIFAAVGTPVAGAESEIERFPVPVLLSELAVETAAEAPSVPMTWTWLADFGDGVGFRDLYGATKPALPSGSTQHLSPPPAITSLPAGTILRHRVETAGGVLAGGALSEQGFAAGSTGTTKPASFTAPLPTGGAAPVVGDVVEVYIGTQAFAWLPPSADWTLKSDTYGGTAAAPTQRLMVYYATHSATLSYLFTAAGGATGLAAYATLVHRNARGGDPFDIATAVATAGGASVVGPAGSVGSDGEIAYHVFVDVLRSGATGTAGTTQTTGKTQDITPVTGLTEIVDVVTTRPVSATVTVNNIGLAIARFTPGAAGSALAARASTLAGGAGPGTDTNWIAALFSVAAASGIPAGTGVQVSTMARIATPGSAYFAVNGGTA